MFSFRLRFVYNCYVYRKLNIDHHSNLSSEIKVAAQKTAMSYI